MAGCPSGQPASFFYWDTHMINRLAFAFMLMVFLVGCGGDAKRNINRDRDRPRSSDPAKKEKAAHQPTPDNRVISA